MQIRDFNTLNDLDLKIIECSINEFQENGFHKASVDKIADMAGVGKGTVYRHFGNKILLFFNAFFYILSISTEQLEKIDLSPGFDNAWNKYIEMILNFSKRWGKFFLAISKGEEGMLVKREANRNIGMKKQYGYLVHYKERGALCLQRILELGQKEGKVYSDIKCDILAEMLLVNINHYLMVKTADNEMKRALNIEEKYSLDEGVAELKRFVCRGIGIYKNDGGSI
jgi:AcrR family transcriptional regulator